MINKNKPAEKEQKKVVNYPIVLAGTNGKLVLTERLMSQIHLLHAIGGNNEWSGPVMYTVENGDIDNPKSLEVVAQAMYPMDMGTSVYTEYDFEPEETFDMHDFYPEIIGKDKWRVGHMHTHHNMKAYFSGTDDQELKDNTPNHAFYLSLIVNHEGKYVARLCIMADREVSGTSGIKFDNVKGVASKSTQNIKHTEKVVYAVDLDVVYPENTVPPFLAEFNKIAERKKVREAAKTIDREELRRDYYKNNTIPGNRQLTLGDAIDDDVNWEFPRHHMELTDADIARDYLYAVMALDSDAEGHLPSLAITLGSSWKGWDQTRRTQYLSEFGETINTVWRNMFPEDNDMVNFETVWEEAKMLLFPYEEIGFVEELLEYMDLIRVVVGDGISNSDALLEEELV